MSWDDFYEYAQWLIQRHESEDRQALEDNRQAKEEWA